MKRELLVLATLTMIAVIGLTVSQYTSASEARYCADNPDHICMTLYEHFPEQIQDVIMNIPGVIEYEVIDNPWQFQTNIRYNNTDNDLTPHEVQRYIEGLETSLKVNRALWNDYPDGLPAPLCFNPVDGVLPVGMYIVSGEVFLQPNDERCYGHCAGDLCPPELQGPRLPTESEQ